jgi:hypothetical protein
MPPRSQEQQVLRQETIGGYTTLVVKTGSSLRWHAPELNCAVLQLAGSGGHINRFVSLTPGEPSPAIMTVPGHYKEVSPSGLGKSATTLMDDKFYFRHRPPAALLSGGQ